MPADDPTDIVEDLPPPDSGDDAVRDIFRTVTQRREPALPVPRPAGQPPTGQPPIDETQTTQPPSGKVFDTKTRLNAHEFNQRVITFAVMGLLTIVVVVICLGWIFYPTLDLNNFSTVLLVPLIAFAGPIMGFYFGKKKGN